MLRLLFSLEVRKSTLPLSTTGDLPKFQPVTSLMMRVVESVVQTTVSIMFSKVRLLPAY